MAASLLDTEFMQYWAQLDLVEKESLLTVAKNYIHLKDGDNADALRKRIIQKECEAYLRGEGVSYNWQQVKEMAVNKQKRNAL